MQLDNEKELLDRTRRIETRLVNLIEHLGVVPDRVKPTFAVRGDKGIITVPSIRTAIEDIMNAIPKGWSTAKWVEVVHKGQRLAILYKPEDAPS